jgi:ParB family chromosome partitioning protein
MSKTQDEVAVLETKRKDLYEVDPRNVKLVDGYNIRNIDPDSDDIQHLKASIKENGLQRPLMLKANPDAAEDGKEYIAVDGHRRLTAINLLIAEGEDIRYVKAEISKRMNDEQALLAMFTLNDGEPLNPIEKSEGVRRLIDVYGYTPAEVATKIAETQATISNLMKLANMPKNVRNKVAQNVISASLVLQISRTIKDDTKFAEKVEELTKGVEATVATDKGKKKKRAKVTAKAAKAVVGEKNTVKLLEETALALEKDGTDNPSVDLLFKLVKALKKQPTVETLKALFE